MSVKLLQRSTRVTLLCVALLLCLVPCAAQGVASEMDEYVKAKAERSHFSGAVLVARGGQVILSRGYGMASVEHEVPNTPQTKFRIGSLTKQFTAMSVMMLQERGRLSVEDSICKYLPQCPEKFQPITIRHLLTHTSGIPNFSYSPNRVEQVSTSPLARHMEQLGNAPLEFKPGERFSYSNSGYVLLGHIIEKASGVPYEQFLRENIFEPLQMKNTGYEERNSIVKHRASGYSLRGDALRPAPFVDMSMPYSAGGLYSTVEDMYLWDQSLYTEKLVSRQSLDAVFTPFKGNYGYGWDVVEQFGRRCTSHMGWIEGYASYILRLPGERLTVVVMSNVDAAPVHSMARDLAAFALGLRPADVRQRKAVEGDASLYDAYVGRYEVAPDLVVTVTKEGGRLMAQAPGRPKLELLPESEIEFFVKEYDAQVMFVWGGEGRVSHAVVSLNGRETQAEKIE